MALTMTLILLAIFIFINVPIAFALIASSFVYFMLSDNFTNIILIQRIVGGVESIPLLAIVFFITAGILMNYTGITRRMLTFADVITGHLPGGMAKVNVVLSTLMGGLSGSNIADAAMQSKIIVPEMEKKGYSKGFATSLTAASSLITPIIPPGIALIMYGYVGDVSIGDLFLAGIIPGIVLCILMLVLVDYISKKRGYEVQEGIKRPETKKVIGASKDAALAILLPVIIIGGIRFGVFSPTEAGAVAVFYALFLGLIVFRQMKVSELLKPLIETVYTAASILIIIAGASAFAWVLTVEQVPQRLTEVVTGFVGNSYMFLIIMMIFLLIVGMFIEGNVALIILTPLFMPMLEQYGIDPVHFGIFFIICLSIGTITPPLGTVMFSTCSITGAKIEEFMKEVLPFYAVLIVGALIIAFFPIITLLLPSWL
ncbi:TRAP transporter large permease [Gracilibacillus saliphilus]|uniref:TRAP transporter large permease n=1 Tax=Gracilibacillus saliphilus TaxID=543890 RepID=UPI0013D19EE9|nr:TRAP transporter large permease [Gracilibacillus saliphilus]